MLAIREYRALFGAIALSWAGDYIAKAAVTALVYERTSSAAAAAVTFAMSYAPWLLIGPLLAALAERFPLRTVMITSDLLRMVLIALVAIDGLPVPLMIVLLFLTSLGNPPFDAARSALLPAILPGDKLVVGLSLVLSVGQAAQIGGYLVGGLISGINPQLALLIDSATFALSALLLAKFLQRRPAANGHGQRNLIRETADGFRVVFGTPTLRAIALLVFASMLFPTIPEGLAAVWAALLHPATDAQRGLTQGLIMMAVPVGFIIGGLIVGRLVPPEPRRRLIRPLAVIAPLALVPALFEPPLPVVCGMAALCGFCIAGLVPSANALFVQVLPNQYRARAFGVMQSGVQLLQGGSVIVVGLLVEQASLPRVVGLWSLGGVIVVLGALLFWPTRERFTTAIADAKRLNEGPAAPAPSAG